MTDIYDQASDLEELQRQSALAEHARRHPAPATDWQHASAKWCQGAACGVRIPDQRRRAIPGVQLCIDCQERKEALERRNAR